MRSRLTVVAVLCCLAVTVLRADPVADGLIAWRAGDYAAAHRQWQGAAAAGDAQAMFLLSEVYAHGKGVDQDSIQAVDWLTAAARQGHSLACHNLGDRYLNGRDVVKAPVQAAYWWRCAATRGLVQAQYNLGTLYYQGQGVPRDPEQAAWWYQQAAEQGSIRARKALVMLQRAGVRQPTESPAGADGRVTTAGVMLPLPPLNAAVAQSKIRAPSADAAAPEGRLVAMALGSDWLRQQSPEHYTVQVFASDDLAAVKRFLNASRFSRQVAVYPFVKAGKRWHGVVYGRFDDRDAARAALADLPATVRRDGPWVRQLKAVVGQLDRQDDEEQDTTNMSSDIR